MHAQASFLDAKIVPLRDVVKRVVNDRKLAMVTRGIRVDLNCENVTAYCDEEKVRVMLDNLLSNAVKYSPERGLIAVKLYKDRSDAVFEVSDEGPGIPTFEREKVFEAFFRGTDSPVAAIKGSGLGLSIVKEYVQLHKGRVEILDGPGAHFRIRIPRKREAGEAGRMRRALLPVLLAADARRLRHRAVDAACRPRPAPRRRRPPSASSRPWRG